MIDLLRVLRSLVFVGGGEGRGDGVGRIEFYWILLRLS